jgi:hypothetical protein
MVEGTPWRYVGPIQNMAWRPILASGSGTVERKIVDPGREISVVSIGLPLHDEPEEIDVEAFHRIEIANVQREMAEACVRRSLHSARLHHMPRKSVVKSRCALCGAKEVSEPRGEEKYCRDCWDRKIAVEEIVAREFALKRYIRAHSAEKYLIYHSTLKRPCGQLIVVDDGYDLFLTLMLYPNFGWDEPAYHLEGDPEGRMFSELLVDVVAAEVIEPWGGGKWHMEIFRSVNPEPEDWNGEM